MTRKDEISQAAAVRYSALADCDLFTVGFTQGANWADENPCWHSVKDTLPSIIPVLGDSDTVIAYADWAEYRNKYSFYGFVMPARYKPNGEWVDLQGFKLSVRYWMPMPNAPKGGDI